MKIDINPTLQPVQNPVEIQHQNYLEYLSVCWANHYGAVISPDMLWHIVLCELSMEVSKNPETYRDLFSDSKEKQEISVLTDDPMVLPVEKVVEILKSKCNFNIDLFMLRFSTTQQMERFAFGVAFLDLVSPYYSYSMYCCGIPYVELCGSAGDYHMGANILDELSVDFAASPPLSNWLKSAADTFQQLSFVKAGLQNNLDFTKFFALERCGSGSQVEVAGWIRNFFFFQPDVRYVKNFNSCVSRIEYKYLPTQTEYVMTVALNESFLVGDFLVPTFNAKVVDKNEAQNNSNETEKPKNLKIDQKIIKDFKLLDETTKYEYFYIEPGFAKLDNRRILGCSFE